MKSNLVRRLLAAYLLSTSSITAAAEGEAKKPAEHGHFHHIHINVSDIVRTTAFYEKVFGVVPVQYGNRQPALLTERSFIFMNQVPPPIKSQLLTGAIHIGWSGVDGKNEFSWWQQQGVEVHTPLSKIGTGEYMYLYGPDREVIEIWTNERHHRLNHIHLLAVNPKETAEWFARVIHSNSPAIAGQEGVPNWAVKVDNVWLHVLPDNPFFKPKERKDTAMQATDGSGIDHVAFSFRDLNAAHKRVVELGIPIEKAIGRDNQYGVESFFVRAPNGVLVELVRAKPLPDAAWE